MVLLDGMAIAKTIRAEIQSEVEQLAGRKPRLSVILVGSDPASLTYVTSKQKRCRAVGMHSDLIRLPEETTQDDLFAEIDRLGNDPTIDGILVQRPLPPQINPIATSMRIPPDKDVDGLTPVNMGKLLLGDPSGFVPCTPLGIQTMLDRSGISVAGKRVVIVGRSNIVGKPLAILLGQKGCDATVTLAHSRTPDLPSVVREADLVVAAVGSPKLIGPEMIKSGAVVIDVGMNRVEDASQRGYHLCGDVDFERVQERCAAITPVPGGVGPLTIAMLLRNALDSYKRREKCSD